MRSHFRQSTLAAHRQLDQAMRHLDLARRADYLVFLRLHQRSFDLLAMMLPPTHWLCGVLATLSDCVAADLQILQATGLTRPVTRTDVRLDALAVGYVVCGSHFGKAVLRKQWLLADDVDMRRAGAYLDSDVLCRAWQRWTQDAVQVSSSDPDIDKLCVDANRTFDVYHAALRSALRQEPDDAEF